MARYLSYVAALAATGALAITPELMLSAPRRSVAVPNPSGELALFSVSTYSFKDQSRPTEWKLLDLKSGDIKSVALNGSDVSEIVWLPGSTTGIVYINGTSDDTPGGVSLWVGDVQKPEQSKLAASLPASFSGLKVAKTSSGSINFLVNSLAYQNGTAYNAELVKKPRSTARFYSDIFPRHWDTWLTKQRYAVFAGTLQGNSSYSLASPGLRNVNKDLNFTITRPETPVQPFGDDGDYDITSDGKTIAFLSKAPQLPKANYTASYIYLAPFDGSAAPKPINGPGSEADKAGAQGASGAPTFSPDGKKIAYFQQDGIAYESDKSKLYVADISSGYGDLSVSNWHGVANDWDRSVGGIKWAPKSDSIYVSADDFAITRIFNLPLNATKDFSPKNLTGITTVTGFSVLPDSSIFTTATSVWSSADYYITKGEVSPKLLFSATTTDKELAGLGPQTVDQFFFTGNKGGQLHALVVKPSGFSSDKKYPLAFIVHGGPQGSNANAWSTRWNLQVWADQGYVVVAPNPTGSTGFGQALTDAIGGNWGGDPYEDLVRAWQYVKDNLTYVDTDHGIEAGASYGGYMTNWIQGHDLGRKFRALVTHDGVSNTLGDYGTEELWFIQKDNAGNIWDNRDHYDRWNPLNHIKNWSTPHFVVHNSMDYRLPESDGLALFNILQERGVPSRFLNFPDENHWVLKPENSLFWHTEIFNWINHWSGVGGGLDDVPVGE